MHPWVFEAKRIFAARTGWLAFEICNRTMIRAFELNICLPVYPRNAGASKLNTFADTPMYTRRLMFVVRSTLAPN